MPCPTSSGPPSSGPLAVGSLDVIGNATTLIRLGPFTLLTDPNFLHRGQFAYLGYGLVSRRLSEPALSVTELPDLDLIVLSHLHGDHWDRVARHHFDRALPIVTTPHAARRLQGWHRFRRAVGLATWETSTAVKDGAQLAVTALPGRHAPGPFRRLLPPVMGSLLEFGPVQAPPAYRLYVTGDTLLFEGIAEIARRYQDIDAALVHLGGTKLPGGLLVTMDGRQGADLVELVQPRTAVPIHVDDYTVFTSPLSAFEHEVRQRGLADRVRVVARGERIELRSSARPPR